MPLTKLQFQPGINKETTSYSNEGGWFDMDKVRFRAGYPEKIGGWTKIGHNSFLGSCRALHSWRTIALDNYLGVGTSEKYYIESGQGYYDITPLRVTVPPNENITVTVSGNSATGEVGSIEEIILDATIEILRAMGIDRNLHQIIQTMIILRERFLEEIIIMHQN